jgi:hypothetical protein
MNKWLGVAAAVVLGTGCNYGASAFQCNDDTQCGATGRCEPGFGFCSFPDEEHCGPGGRSFGDLADERSNTCVDPPNIDAGIDPPDAPPDAQTCFGTSIVQVCLAAAPTTPRTISTPTTIDTDDPPMCAATVSGADNYCVLVGTTITVNATLRATGPKPLVLIASDSIIVNQLIDVGSHRATQTTPDFVGAGADPMTCMAGTLAGTRSGGAGGTFTGKGGNGGNGAGGGAGTGGQAVNGVTTVTELRGGCPGQNGNGATGGTGGHGGGAVFLIAGNDISVNGPINAAGEGGAGGATDSSAGGGGGGAGGMIGLDAPTITVTITSLLLANGGGGGEGSGTNSTGSNGEDPSTTAAATGGNGGTMIGGDGGNGSAGPAAGAGADANDGITSMNGNDGGGGGGGGGAGLIKGPAASLGTNVSPAATP